MEINEKKEKKKKSKKRKRDMYEEEILVKRKEEDMGEKKEEEKEEEVLERFVKKRKERIFKSSYCLDIIDIRDKLEKMDAEESIASVGIENSIVKIYKKKKKRLKD